MAKKFQVAAGLLLLLAGAAVLVPRGREPATPDAEARPEAGSRFQVVDVSAHASDGLALSGRVLDPQGRPLSGVEVLLASSEQKSLASARCEDCGQSLLSCPARESALHVLELLRRQEGLLAAAAHVRTDAEGRFRFEHLAGVAFTLWANAPGFATAVHDRAAPGEPVDLVLGPPRSLRGSVQDVNGRSVAGARVYAVSRRAPLLQQTLTDSRGSFELGGLGEGPFYVLAEADGLLPEVEPQVNTGNGRVDLVLQTPRALEVSVRQDGKPVAARVRIHGDHLDRELEASGGMARFEGLYPDALVVTAALGERSAGPHSLTLSRDVTRVELELELGGRLAVSVVDEGGEPVPQPKLTLGSAAGEVIEARTLRTGELAMVGPLAVGQYQLRASADGYRFVEQPVTVKAGETPVELVMARGDLISGRVLDEYGRPLPGISVSVEPIGEATFTGDDGRFSVLVPTPGFYTIDAHHSEWGGARVQVSAPAKDVEVRLEPRSTVEVVVEADGQPVEGASVMMLLARESAFHTDQTSSADGHVRMRGVPAGVYTLIAEHPRYLPSEKQTVKLEDGQTVKVTAKLQAGAVISGEVVDDHGQPVEGAFVSTVPPGAAPATTDGRGHFEVRPLVPGAVYRLDARHPLYDGAMKDDIAAGSERVTLVLREKLAVRGRVVSSDGTPLKRFEVDGEAVSSPDGRFETRVPSDFGRVSFIVAATGYEPALVDKPESTDVGDVVLAPAPELSGVVQDEHGAPVQDAVVTCNACDQSTVSGKDGTFRMSRSSAVTSISVSARRGRQSGTIEIPAEGSGQVKLVLKAAVHLHGTVYLSDGKPAVGRQVEIFDADRSEMVTLVTGADGSYSADVPQGNYRVPLNPLDGDTAGLPLIFVAIQGTDMPLDIGPAPGTSTLTVRVAPEAGHALWVVPGSLSTVPDPPMDLLKLPYGQLVFQPPNDTVLVQGLRPGRYTLVWASPHFQTPGGALLRTVDAYGGAQEISLAK